MNTLKEILLENWNLKIAAIFMAFVLWLLVRGDPGTERVLSVPLEIRVPRNMQVTSDRPNTVDVTVRGASTNLWFSPNVPTYVIDMQLYREGEHQVQLSPENVRFTRASGLAAVAVRPARLRLKIELTIPREVPVRVATTGQPMAGIEVYSTEANPARVVLSGPRSSVEKLREVSTEPLSIAGMGESLRTFVSLDIKDDAVHSSPPGPVEVNIQLGAHRRLQRIARVPIAVEDGSVTVSPATVTVQALVPVTHTKPLAPADFIAVAAPPLPPDRDSAKARPEVKLRNFQDPAIVIKDVAPAEVTLQRKRS